ncbi:UNVERIFIED_CONTAM: hypothetical protein GTU68_038907 [Idotea baltica]|nr:hypothetical protein [Idotea baltica]
MKNLLTIIFILLLFISCNNTSKKEIIKPNIVLIMADDLGYGGVSGYGNTEINTPNIDYLISQGVKFTDFHSNGSVCSPTRAALMTGKYQQRTGVEGVVTAKSHRHVGLDLEEITIAEELKKHNYNCGMYGKWHLGYSKEFNPTLQGFDDFVGFVSGNVDYHAHIDQEGYLDWWKGDKIDNEKGYTTDLISNYGVNYIKDNNRKKTNKPFFLYLPHEAPHGPYQRRIDNTLRTVGTAGSAFVSKDSIAGIYKEMVEVMDEGIGDIVDVLKETGEYENTIIIFISDNGANSYGDNGGLRGFKGGPYEGGSRVPAVISYPNVIKAGMISDQVVLSMDLLPTLLDFIDQKPSGNNIDGLSIKNLLLNQSELKDRDLFYSFNGRSFIRSGKWKMVKVKNKDGEKLELYNLDTDLAEKNDLSTKNSEVLTELKKKLSKWEGEVRKDVKKVS